MGMRQYVRTMMGDPKVASIAPSSQFAIRRVCRNADFSQSKVVVEYGPGGGCFTRYVLERMPQDGVFVAFETNTHFSEVLRADIRDPRLHVVNRSAEFILDELAQLGFAGADYIISGIPFSMIPDQVKDRILRSTASALSEEGRFLTYQFVPPLASFDRFLKRPMEKFLSVVRVEYEVLNLPPLRIYESKPRPEFARRAPLLLPRGRAGNA